MVQETDEPIIIGKAGKPIAVLSAYKETLATRKLGGSWEGKVKITNDFDQLDNETTESFYKSVIFPTEK